MGTKIIYRAFSFFEFARTLVLRLVCVVAMVYALAHYEENPVVIIVFACFCMLFILFLGDDQITVYSDRIVQLKNSIGSLIFNAKGKTFYMHEIKTAYLQPKSQPSVLEIGVIATLATVTPNRRSNIRTRPIYLELVNGETEEINTCLDIDQMQQIVNQINLVIVSNER